MTAGTLLDRTRKPLRLWFEVMWLVASQKNGASAKNLQQALGLGSYETAWAWLHKLRRAMIRPGREQLRGVVEVDETYIGGHDPGVLGRSPQSAKTLVAVAVERVGDRIGRVRFRCIPNAGSAALRLFVKDHVEPGAQIITDGWNGYAGLEKLGFGHTRKSTPGKREAGEMLAVDFSPRNAVTGSHVA